MYYDHTVATAMQMHSTDKVVYMIGWECNGYTAANGWTVVTLEHQWSIEF